MGRAAVENILHGLVAALTIVLMVGGGRIRDPQSRLHFWLVGLACPVVLGPAFWWLAPVRLDEGFRDGWALFAGDRLALLAFRGGEKAGLVAHMERAIRFGATKEEIFEVLETCLVPGGAPTFHRGLGALLEVKG